MTSAIRIGSKFRSSKREFVRGTRGMVQLTDDMLREMVNTVIRAADPERVYLFGSHARGSATVESDVDLLIVERGPFGADRSRRREMARLWRVLAAFRVPKDILVYSVDEVEHWKHARNHVVAQALNEGRLIYERPRIRRLSS